MKGLTIALVMFLSACSSSTVYLNQRYLSEHEVRSLTQQLQDHSFAVERVDVPFPASVITSTLLHSPLLTDETQLGLLQETLKQQGYSSIDVIALTKDNHWYKSNNFGLYLLGAGVDDIKQSSAALAKDYVTRDCEKPHRLSLNKQGRFALYQGQQLIAEGQWQVPDSHYLRLHNDEPYINFYYEVSQQQQTDAVGQVNITQLSPMSDPYTIPDCTMVHGVRH